MQGSAVCQGARYQLTWSTCSSEGALQRVKSTVRASARPTSSFVCGRQQRRNKETAAREELHKGGICQACQNMQALRRLSDYVTRFPTDAIGNKIVGNAQQVGKTAAKTLSSRTSSNTSQVLPTGPLPAPQGTSADGPALRPSC